MEAAEKVLADIHPLCEGMLLRLRCGFLVSHAYGFLHSVSHKFRILPSNVFPTGLSRAGNLPTTKVAATTALTHFRTGNFDDMCLSASLMSPMELDTVCLSALLWAVLRYSVRVSSPEVSVPVLGPTLFTYDRFQSTSCIARWIGLTSSLELAESPCFLTGCL